MPEVGTARPMDETDRRIVNALHGDFPLCDEPYRAVAERLGITEKDLLARLEALLGAQILTRFGPMFQIERMGGCFLLAALKVPEEDFERIAGIVNDQPEVAHNYRREHEFNMWFVLATESQSAMTGVVERLEDLTGHPVRAFPKQREYFVELKLRA